MPHTPVPPLRVFTSDDTGFAIHQAWGRTGGAGAAPRKAQRRVFGYHTPSSRPAPTPAVYAAARQACARGVSRASSGGVSRERLEALARPHSARRLLASRTWPRGEPMLSTARDADARGLQRMMQEDSASRDFLRGSTYRSLQQEVRQFDMRQRMRADKGPPRQERESELQQHVVRLDSEKEGLSKALEGLDVRLRVIDRRLEQLDESRQKGTVPRWVQLMRRGSSALLDTE
eukprot:TRINITY_DN26496_c0_g1_i1.p1 TRINITY_DN26496_c0_g1~~TRINITY_DN26496_c0_g1_i1.p1  ORF type:complete len:259 (+),score=63.08 TRINITY_DN26496_c0_g1_i1:82-777(+)